MNVSASPPPESPPLEVSWDGAVLTLGLHRPARRNALNDDLVDALLDALRSEAGRARAIVLTGGDEFFCAGGDVGTMPGPDAGLFGPSRRLSRIHAVADALRDAPAPSIAAVERYAIGAGWGLALACDLVVSGRGARFSAPFAQRGLASDAGVSWHLHRRLGRHGANRHLLLGETLEAGDAEAAGLVSRLCDDGTAAAVAQDLARRLADSATEAMAVTRWMGEVAEAQDARSYLREERVGVSLAGHGREAAEGRAAFTEKREPRFR